MNCTTKYYICAFDINGRITAALSCPDEETAKRVYPIALRAMEKKHDTNEFLFHCIEINVLESRIQSSIRSIQSAFRSLPPHGLTVLSKPSAIRDITPHGIEDNLNIDELKRAESETRKILSEFPPPYQRQDIQFMYYAKLAIEELIVTADTISSSSLTVASKIVEQSEPPPITPEVDTAAHSQIAQDDEQWLGSREAVKSFGRSKTTFHERVKAGLIQKRKVGGKMYYLESSVLECKRRNP